MREEDGGKDGETIYGVNSEKLAYEGKRKKKGNTWEGSSNQGKAFVLVLRIGDSRA